MNGSQFVCECGFEEFWAVEANYGIELECTRCNRSIEYKLPAYPKTDTLKDNVQTDYVVMSLENLRKLMSK